MGELELADNQQNSITRVVLPALKLHQYSTDCLRDLNVTIMLKYILLLLFLFQVGFGKESHKGEPNVLNVELDHKSAKSYDELKTVMESFRQEMNEQIKVIRNATMFLLTAISSRANACQGIRDSASKIRILHSALALQDPDIKINIPEEYVKTDEKILDFEPEELPDVFFTPEEITNTPIQETTTASMSPTTITPKQKPCGYVSEEYPDTFIQCPPPLALPGIENHKIETTTLKEMKYYITDETIPETLKNYDKMAIDGYYSDTSTQSNDKPISAESQAWKTPHLFRCPEIAKKVGNECFSLHLDKQLNWNDARAFCRSLGGDLAEPDLQNNRLPRQLLKAWPSLRDNQYWTLWVGATDLEKEGNWHWVTGGILDLKASSRWDLVEPPDEVETQDCLAMILWVPGRWRRWDLLDDPCELEWIVFCEYSTIHRSHLTP